jgi:hypothetical protein
VYGYVLGTPNSAVDPSGLWAKFTHRMITRRALRREFRGQGLSFRTRRELIRAALHGNIAVDERGATDPRRQHEHAMQNADMTPEESRQESNEFINDRLRTAIRLARDGEMREAYSALGEAMHTVQDAASPTHGSDHPWPEGIPIQEQMEHTTAELFLFFGLGWGNTDSTRPSVRARQAVAGSRELHEAFRAGVEAANWSFADYKDVEYIPANSEAN